MNCFYHFKETRRQIDIHRETLKAKMDEIALENGICVKTLYGHTDLVRSVINSRNSTLICSSLAGSIKFWNLETGLCIFTIKDDESE